jgi:hypothetical protein
MVSDQAGVFNISRETAAMREARRAAAKLLPRIDRAHVIEGNQDVFVDRTDGGRVEQQIDAAKLGKDRGAERRRETASRKRAFIRRVEREIRRQQHQSRGEVAAIRRD